MHKTICNYGKGDVEVFDNEKIRKWIDIKI